MVKALADMRAAAIELSARQRVIPVCELLPPSGFGPEARTRPTVDPPPKAKLWETLDYVKLLEQKATATGADWSTNRADFVLRDLTLVWPATANAATTDSEHPWDGFLTLIDALYTRTAGRLHTFERDHNLVYEVPVDVTAFEKRLNRSQPPTSAYIADIFSDLLVMKNGVIPGRPIREAGRPRLISHGNARVYGL